VKNKLTLHILSFFLFATLLLKVSAIHVYSHEDSQTDTIENCTFCKAVVENQQSEHVVPDSDPLTLPTQFFFKPENTSRYATAHTSFTLRSQYFGRPPPAIG